MRQCPSCQSEDIHRSRTKTLWETWRREITRKRPFRCRACGWRGWGADMGSKVGRDDRSPATEPPNLKGTALARSTWTADIDLDELDRPRRRSMPTIQGRSDDLGYD